MTDPAAPADNRRWGVLALTILVTTIGMMGFAAVFPLLSLWIRDLGISRAAGGLLSGLWYLPGVLVALPAGFAFDRWPVRRVLALCWAFIVAGTVLMAVAPGFTVLCAGRLLFAIGMNAHMVGAPKLVAAWFAGRRELGLVMGLYTLAFTAGVFLALNVLGSIGEASGWRPALQLLAGLSAAGWLMVMVLPAAPKAPATAAPRATGGFRPMSLGAGAWILALAYFGYSIGTEAYLTFAPDFLVGRGHQVAAAAAIVGSYALPAFILKPILSSFLRPATAIPYVVVATLLALLCVALLLTPGVPPVAASMALGVSLAAGMPAFFALPAFLLPPDRSGQAYGLYQMFYSLGFFAQPLVGLTADRTGSYTAAFGLVAVYCVLGLAVLLPTVRRMRTTAAVG